MPILPDFDTFARLASQGRIVPVYRRLFGDVLTPVEAYRRIERGPSSFLFESVVGGEKIGRYSFLGADPFLRLEAFGNDVVVTREERSEQFQFPGSAPRFGAAAGEYRAVHIPGLPRFCGGAVGYAGYDIVRYSEHCPMPPDDDRYIPDMAFAFYDRMVIFDQISKTILVIAHTRPDESDLTERTSGPPPASTSCAPSWKSPRGSSSSAISARRPDPRQRGIRTSPGPSSRRPSAVARSTFVPAISFRSSSASGLRQDDCQPARHLPGAARD